MLSTFKQIARGNNIQKANLFVDKFGGKANDWVKKKG